MQLCIRSTKDVKCVATLLQESLFISFFFSRVGTGEMRQKDAQMHCYIIIIYIHIYSHCTSVLYIIYYYTIKTLNNDDDDDNDNKPYRTFQIVWVYERRRRKRVNNHVFPESDSHVTRAKTAPRIVSIVVFQRCSWVIDNRARVCILYMYVVLLQRVVCIL